MLSLFKHWNKTKSDPNSRCSSAPMTAKELFGTQEATERAQIMEEKTMPEEPLQKSEINRKPQNTESQPILNDDSLTLRDKIELVLHTVYDPEIPVNIMELGLVYSLEIKENNVVFVTMTLTAPGCPVAGDIVREVDEKVHQVEGVTDVHVQLTFDPQWTKDMMSDEARLELGFM